MGWVPEIDVASGDAARRVGEACERVGFFSIVGHGVPTDVIDDAWRTARAFFDLPDRDKHAVVMPYRGYPYGFAPLAYEALSYSAGTAAPPDLKESFAVGPVDPPLHDFADADEESVWSPNLWPDAVPSLRPAWEHYYRAMSDLARRLLSLMAVALDLEPGYFEPLIDRHTSAMRAINYPVVDAPEVAGQLRAGAHTDYGTLTILLADPDVGGLDVQGPNGQWEPVQPAPGAFVVNLGDAMARWTNDRWRSTLHRVVPSPARRQSIAFFHNANWDALIECLPTCRPERGSARYPPMAAGPHLMAKFRSTVTHGASHTA